LIPNNDEARDMTYLTPEYLINSILEVRKKQVNLRKLKYLSETIDDIDGNTFPLALRPYQVQGALSTYLAPRMVLGDSCGLGKTLQAIAACCCLWETEPNKKVIIVSCKSSVPQWRTEIDRFTVGVKPFLVSTQAAVKEIKIKLFSNKDKSKFDSIFEYPRINSEKDLWENPIYPEMCYLYYKVKDKQVKEKLEQVIKSFVKNESLSFSELEFIESLRGTFPSIPKKFFTDYRRDLSVRYGIPFYHPKFWSNKNNIKLMYLIDLAEKEGNYSDSTFGKDNLKKLANEQPIPSQDIHALKELFKKYRMLSVDTQDLRKREYINFSEYKDGPSVLILTYAKATMDAEIILDLFKETPFVFVCDECTAFKSLTTDVHLACSRLSKASEKCIGLTATLIKNNLLEGYSIYNVVVPGLFGEYNDFLVNFCKVYTQMVGNKCMTKVAGHTDKHIEKFSQIINPYYLGRLKYEVASDLPSIIRKDIYVEMEYDQLQIYAEALSGMLQIGEDLNATAKKISKLTELIYCQQIVDHPKLIDRRGSSVKLEMLIDLLCEGEFKDEKVVVYTRFSEMVSIFEETFTEKKKFVKIIGDMDEKQRDTAKNEFQNNPDVKVVFITDAASHAINLQSASVVIYYDIPFSGGNYLQILGRTDRIGSKYDNIYCVHIVAKGTIDELVLKIVLGKIKTIEKTIGKQIKSTDNFQMDDANQTILKIYNDLVKSAKDLKVAKD
jgi:SNF2 family DNA or RNA helicase